MDTSFNYHQTVATPGNIDPVTPNILEALYQPMDVPGKEDINLQFQYNPTFTRATGDFALIQIPLRVQVRDPSSWKGLRSYEQICQTNLRDEDLFYVRDPSSDELFLLYAEKLATTATTTITVPKMNCRYYPVSNFNNTYLWRIQMYSNTKQRIEQKILKVTDANLGNSFVPVNVYSSALTSILFVSGQYQNDLGS